MNITVRRDYYFSYRLFILLFFFLFRNIKNKYTRVSVSEGVDLFYRD